MPELETRLLIKGEQVAGEGTPLAVENPYSEETIATVGTPSGEQLDAAIAAAREAAPEWDRTPAVDRGELLHDVAAGMRARTDEIAEVMTLEGGKPLVENSDEVGWTAAALDYYAEIGREGLEAFQETKHVHIESEVAPKEWWYPYSEYTGGEPPHGA